MNLKKRLINLLFEKDCMALWGKIIFPKDNNFVLLKNVIISTTCMLVVITIIDYSLLNISIYAVILLSFVTYTIAILAGVVNSLVLFSKYYYKHKSLILYVLGVIILLCVSLSLLVSINSYIAKKFSLDIVDYFYSNRYILLRFITILITVLITFFYDMMAVFINKVLVSNEQNIQSLSLLRTQLNPHFFFNALNNIYSFSFVGDSRAPQLILQLSDLMRYILYESNTSLITLEKDIDFLKKFCALQLVKYDYSNFDFTVNTTSAGLMVPPLLILPLIENMFIHGTAGVKSPFFKIEIKEQNGQVEVTTENFIGRSKSTNSSGVGLDNLRKRLELLFPGRYVLSLDNNNNALFHAKLSFSINI
ncbi:MAG: sensor histidine kinase [Bacteroidetes Order II. Incertae sedis bacterium]|nr:sensor histidine kinase [Bacteroidetes Order II. bacterium]